MTRLTWIASDVSSREPLDLGLTEQEVLDELASLDFWDGPPAGSASERRK